jgi:hypothetical protein
MRREANDSYRGRSRWGRARNPPRGGFFVADFILEHGHAELRSSDTRSENLLLPMSGPLLGHAPFGSNAFGRGVHGC